MFWDKKGALDLQLESRVARSLGRQLFGGEASSEWKGHRADGPCFCRWPNFLKKRSVITFILCSCARICLVCHDTNIQVV